MPQTDWCLAGDFDKSPWDDLKSIEQWLERPGTLASEALLDLLDPGLERSHVLLQLCEVACEDLAPAALVSKSRRLDPTQGLRARVVLLLEALESEIDLIEVPEHLLSQLGEAEVYPVEPLVDLAELAVDLTELAVDLGELASQEFNELLVLDGGHGPYVSQVQALFKCIDDWTSPERMARAKLRQVDTTCSANKRPGGFCVTMQG